MSAAASRIIVTGASGQVGSELLRTLAPFGSILAPTRVEMDLANMDSVRNFIRDIRPRWIVNAGAYTAVDKAEAEPDLAFAINAEAVRTMGVEAHALGAAVLHFSTDYVFDGASKHPYVETDPTGPLNVYGASKLAGEQGLIESGAAALVLRTSWVYGATGKNFLRTILQLARQRKSLRIVADQHGSPTWSNDLARTAAHLIAHCERLATESSESVMDAASRVAGIYHAGGSGKTTWAGFATEAIRKLQEREPRTEFATVTPITTSEYPTPAVRPKNSCLNNEKLFQTFGWHMMPWNESLTHVIAELE